MPNSVPPVDLNSVFLVDFLSEEEGYGHEARQLEQEARDFLLSFRWCSGIVNAYLGDEAAPYFGVFLFLIRPASQDVDRWLWVVVGDLPPAYLVCDDARTPREAVQAYVCEMSKWVAAVRNGLSLEEVIPVNAEPSIENADLLATRLSLLERHFSES
jgi:hypothetical protein